MDPDAVTLSFESVFSDLAALKTWLGYVNDYGFARLTGGPAEPGTLLDVIRLFGYVRETNYGAWFEVRSKVDPGNLAYSDAGLQAHSDNPYRDPVPTLQLLYCLENCGSGGDSLVVDGFASALRLREENQDHFTLLADYCARFGYEGKGEVNLSTRKPLLELLPDGELTGIR